MSDRKTLYVLLSANEEFLSGEPVGATESMDEAQQWRDASDESRNLFRSFEVVALWPAGEVGRYLTDDEGEGEGEETGGGEEFGALGRFVDRHCTPEL